MRLVSRPPSVHSVVSSPCHPLACFLCLLPHSTPQYGSLCLSTAIKHLQRWAHHRGGQEGSQHNGSREWEQRPPAVERKNGCLLFIVHMWQQAVQVEGLSGSCANQSQVSRYRRGMGVQVCRGSGGLRQKCRRGRQRGGGLAGRCALRVQRAKRKDLAGATAGMLHPIKTGAPKLAVCLHLHSKAVKAGIEAG